MANTEFSTGYNWDRKQKRYKVSEISDECQCKSKSNESKSQKWTEEKLKVKIVKQKMISQWQYGDIWKHQAYCFDYFDIGGKIKTLSSLFAQQLSFHSL